MRSAITPSPIPISPRSLRRGCVGNSMPPSCCSRANWECRRCIFRPPYSVDQEPDTADEVRPAGDGGEAELPDRRGQARSQRLEERSRAYAAADRQQRARANTAHCRAAIRRPCGNVVLLHDGGGDRSHTVEALPLLIHALRDNGYELVPVSTLLGKTRDQVMPPISPRRAMEGVRRFAGIFDLECDLRIYRAGVFHGRHPDDRTAGVRGRVRDLRPLAQQHAGGRAGAAASRRSRCYSRRTTKRRWSSGRCGRCWLRIIRTFGSSSSTTDPPTAHCEIGARLFARGDLEQAKWWC